MATSVRVVLLPGGNIQVFVDGDVSFEEAEGITRQFVADLRAAGVGSVTMGEVEQHKAGVDHVHVYQEHQHGHE